MFPGATLAIVAASALLPLLQAHLPRPLGHAPVARLAAVRERAPGPDDAVHRARLRPTLTKALSSGHHVPLCKQDKSGAVAVCHHPLQLASQGLKSPHSVTTQSIA